MEFKCLLLFMVMRGVGDLDYLSVGDLIADSLETCF